MRKLHQQSWEISKQSHRLQTTRLKLPHTRLKWTKTKNKNRKKNKKSNRHKTLLKKLLPQNSESIFFLDFQSSGSLREKCPYLEFFLSVFSRIWTEYGEIFRISPYSVRIRENVEQKNSEYGPFSRSGSWSDGLRKSHCVK